MNQTYPRAIISLLLIGCISCDRHREFPLSHTTQSARLGRYQQPASTKLTDHEVIQVTTGLEKYLRANQPGIAHDFQKYYFQLAAEKSSGQTIVLVNAFHEAELQYSPDWQTKPVQVKGGGEQYWNARYSLATDSVIQFWVNAEK